MVHCIKMLVVVMFGSFWLYTVCVAVHIRVVCYGVLRSPLRALREPCVVSCVRAALRALRSVIYESCVV